MFTVKIESNGRLLYARTANRLSGGPGELCLYVTDDGKFIEHHYDAGAPALAARMLSTVQNILSANHKARIARWERKMARIAEDENQ